MRWPPKYPIGVHGVITPIAVMLKDEGDDSNSKNSNEVMAIDYITCFQKGQL